MTATETVYADFIILTKSTRCQFYINGYKVSTRPMNSWHPENTVFFDR